MSNRAYAEAGSLDWRQMDPNRLVVKRQGSPEEIHHAAAPYLGDKPLSTKRELAGILMHIHPALSRETAALTPAASPGSGRMDNLLKAHT